MSANFSMDSPHKKTFFRDLISKQCKILYFIIPGGSRPQLNPRGLGGLDHPTVPLRYPDHHSPRVCSEERLNGDLEGGTRQ